MSGKPKRKRKAKPDVYVAAGKTRQMRIWLDEDRYQRVRIEMAKLNLLSPSAVVERMIDTLLPPGGLPATFSAARKG